MALHLYMTDTDLISILREAGYTISEKVEIFVENDSGDCIFISGDSPIQIVEV